MPSLFDEYRTLLELQRAVVNKLIDTHGMDKPVTLGMLGGFLALAIAQIAEAEAKAS